MKIVCLILMLVSAPDNKMALIQAEKPFQSIQQCQAWKHQKEFLPPVRPVLATEMACVKFWEA